MTDPFLTDDEHEAMRLSGELANVLRRVVGDGPCAEGDWNEMAGSIHDLQARVMGQAAARAYPDLFRPLGGWPEPEKR